jgi:hypothetical protein
MFDPVEMLSDYEIMSKQRLELFNILVKVNIGWIKKEDISLPINLLEKQYNALDEYTKSLGLCLNLLGVELPDID